VVPADDLEVAVLDRTRSQERKFKRLSSAQLNALLGERPDQDSGGATPGQATSPSTAAPTSEQPSTTPSPVAPPVAPPTPYDDGPKHVGDPATPDQDGPHPPVDPGDPLA